MAVIQPIVIIALMVKIEGLMAYAAKLTQSKINGNWGIL